MNRTEAREKERQTVVAKVDNRIQKIDARSIPVELLSDKLIETNGNIARTADFFNIRYTDLARLCDRKPTLRNTLVDTTPEMGEVKMKMDLTKLSGNQLRQLQEIMTTVKKDDTIIDVTPKSQDEKTDESADL